MSGLIIKIETVNGLYHVRKPMGRFGAKHMAIITGAASMNQEKLPEPKEGEEPQIPKMSERDMEKLVEAFEKWAVQVLPHIVSDGPFKYDNMPGEDQYAIFLAMMDETSMSEELFRIVE